MAKKAKFDPVVYSVFRGNTVNDKGESVDGWCAVVNEDERLKVSEETKARAIKSILEPHQDYLEAERKYG